MTDLPPLELDVRPLLAAQRGPLPSIMAALARLAPGQALRLIAPFEPRPLYAHLAQRGFTAQPHRRADGAWEILFVPAAT
jgi:uncharacterized protein (DUF2249 family)